MGSPDKQQRERDRKARRIDRQKRNQPPRRAETQRLNYTVNHPEQETDDDDQ